MKFASSFSRKNHLFIGPENRTDIGMLIVSEPVIEVDIGDAFAVKAAIVQALKSSKTVRHPDFRGWNVNDNPQQRAAGIKRWSDFVRGTKFVGIEQRELTMFVPYASKGARLGFEPIGERTVYTTNEDEYVDALTRALEAATSL